ncbi:MAG: DUF2325 domain-containing protein [Gammaproteobacteria bacterium]|nr:DUF2325 domain-containing protein [Gammaproteobacteria bacterium]
MCERHTPVIAPSRCATPNRVAKAPFRRKKLWELDNYFHCCVIGTCLTLSELRQLARKADIPAPPSLSDYELHVVFVNRVREPAELSRLVHKHLDRKYQRALRQIPKTPSVQDLRAYWQSATERGNVAAAFWSVITHPATPRSLLEPIYGEIHMLSHLAGASVRVDMQELNQLRIRCAQQEKDLTGAQDAARRRSLDQQRTIRQLEQRLAQAAQAERRLATAEARLAEWAKQPRVVQLESQVESLSVQRDAAETRAASAARDAAQWKRQACEAGYRADDLQRQLAASLEECHRLETTLANGLIPTPDATGDEAAFAERPPPDLVGRCVLYVGGRRGQCAHFRALVERCNGRFLHHDGGREDARAQLWDVVQHADAVLCPLDCVSHDAMHRIKRFCARHTKPLVFLPRASLAAFTRGLNTVVTGETRQ